MVPNPKYNSRRARRAVGALERERSIAMENVDSGLAEILKAVPQGAEAVFPKAEYDRRLDALRRRIAEKNFDLVLLSGPENIFYLTGQQTPGYYTFQCLCVPASGEP